jgi:hypothetical protein
MRTKRIVLIRNRRRVRIVAEGYGERGQTPALAVIEVPDGDVLRKLAEPSVQARLGLRQKPLI